MFTGKRQTGPEVGRSTESRENRKTSRNWADWLKFVQEFNQTQGSELDQRDTRPYINIGIEGRTFCALLDTGSMVTLVGSNVAEHLDSCGYVPIDTKINLRMANGAGSQINQSYYFKCTINGVEYRIRALVVPTLTTSVLIGMDVIDELHLLSTTTLNNCHELEAQEDRGISSTVHAVTELTDMERQELDTFLRRIS